MTDQMISIGDGFWNIRGTFKIFKFIDIGTHCSLVRLRSGRYVLLDAYTLTGDVQRDVMQLTDGGAALEAILNLHPFHTVHVKAAAAMFPDARLYGTDRHVARAPELNWESLRTDDPALHEQYKDDLEFSVPRGVDFISANEKLHFSSVLVFHKASRTLHVDDTLAWNNLPFIRGLAFHPTLASVLHARPEAAAEFRAWAQELITRCEDVEHLCTAHMRPLPPDAKTGGTIAERVRGALARVEKVLAKHERRHAAGA